MHILFTVLQCQAGRWHGSNPCQLSPEKKFNQKTTNCATEETLYAIRLHKESRDCCLCSYLRVKGNPHFGKQQCPYSYLQPFPGVGVSKRKLNRRRAVKWNVLAMPKQHGLCQDQLGTAVGQPKICYNPELSRTRTPDT